MTTQTYHLTFITPCFCAGASPSVAEVRGPSIRGKLRWWFRVLGGTPGEEAALFGSVRGEGGGSSSFLLRVRQDPLRSQWRPTQFSGVSNTGYVLYFAKASANGARWVPGGALPEGSSFEMQVVWRRNLEGRARMLFDLAVDCFLMFGSLGLRSTRGLGCFECTERPFSEAEFERLVARVKAQSPRFVGWVASFTGSSSGVLEALGAQLRGLRCDSPAVRDGRPNPTPLGSSQPRQASAVHLRPVKEGADVFRIVVFEAPADRVLGPESRHGAPLLKSGVPAPREVPGAGRRGIRGWRT
jgi:CRISPR-associated protein Cmr1